MALSLGLVLSVTTISAAATAAAKPTVTYEWNTAVWGDPPSGLSCSVITGAAACYQRYGDKIWVKDTAKDGWSAVGAWRDYYNTGSQDVLHREGACVNKLGYGQWGVCDKNFPEGTDLLLKACRYDSHAGTWHGCASSWKLYTA